MSNGSLIYTGIMAMAGQIVCDSSCIITVGLHMNSYRVLLQG